MMVTNPALDAFVAQISPELLLAQVLISVQPRGFELRHVADKDKPEKDLKETGVSGLRSLAQVTANGAFRPLKSAPNLQTGWRAVAHDAAELDGALQQLYPNAVADWFAARQPSPPVTNYREFTNRQTGMYRVTQLITDDQAARVIQACCDARFCLKLRFWSVNGLPSDPPESKSAIPCLEPCAVLLEFARTAARIDQSKPIDVRLTSEDARTISASLETAAKQADAICREADFDCPSNPRRLLFTLEKLRPSFAVTAGSTEES